MNGNSTGCQGSIPWSNARVRSLPERGHVLCRVPDRQTLGGVADQANLTIGEYTVYRILQHAFRNVKTFFLFFSILFGNPSCVFDTLHASVVVDALQPQAKLLPRRIPVRLSQYSWSKAARCPPEAEPIPGSCSCSYSCSCSFSCSYSCSCSRTPYLATMTFRV